MNFFKKKFKQSFATSSASILRNPKILEANLIKDEVTVSFNWKKNVFLLFLTLFVTGLFITEIYFGLSWWEDQEIKNSLTINSDLTSLNQEISRIQEQADNSLAYKNKVSEVAKLLNNHIYWSNFFSWLEKNTLSTVKYAGFSGDLSGAYSLTATAGSLAEVSWQAKAFMNDPLTKEVKISGASLQSGDKLGAVGQASFSLLIEVNPNIFKK